MLEKHPGKNDKNNDENMEQGTLTKKIERTIAPMAQTMGYDIVRISMLGAGSSRPTLQIMAERADGTMLIDDCSRLSQAVSALLDVENLIEEAYVLEVSSPGIDRPLTRLKDFDRYAGFETRIEMHTAQDGQRKFKGILRGIDGDLILLEQETGVTARLPFGELDKAKLVLTDDLIRAAMKAEKDSKKKRVEAGEELDEEFDIEEEDDAEDSDAKKSKHKTPSPKKNPKNKKKTGSK
ncbi:MAG: ribosome maturation factor RimP [Alphaproteobacteria bacterium]|nr:ribosome maturation factor RimP [Alphaproteobacteria bacterium]